MVIQEAPLVATHTQHEPAVTPTLPLPPPETTEALVEESV
jgi:hypothetical protein